MASHPKSWNISVPITTRRARLPTSDLPKMMAEAAKLRDRHYGRKIAYSRKVFIPLTTMPRCHRYRLYATRNLEEAFLAQAVLAIAGDGAAANCKEALFTLVINRTGGHMLAEFGRETTLSYLREMALLVFEETGLLPHLNPGVLEAGDYAALREVSVSMGSMLESTSPRLLQKGFCHHGSPDKNPEVRIASMAEAGRQKVPFTSGILIGIGETRLERIEALLAPICRIHLQEIIIQNFGQPDC